MLLQPQVYKICNNCVTNLNQTCHFNNGQNTFCFYSLYLLYLLTSVSARDCVSFHSYHDQTNIVTWYLRIVINDGQIKDKIVTKIKMSLSKTELNVQINFSLPYVERNVVNQNKERSKGARVSLIWKLINYIKQQ